MAEEKNTIPSSQWNQEEENQLKLADIWAMFWNNRIWYIISVVLCVLVAVFYIYHTPKTFSRTAKVIVDDNAENSALRDLSSFATPRIRSYYNSGPNVYNEMQAFSSPDLMQQVINRLGYQTSYTELQRFRKREKYLSSPITMETLEVPLRSFSFEAHPVDENGNKFVLKDFRVGREHFRKTKIEGAPGDTLNTPAGRMIIHRTANIDVWENDIRVSWINSMTRAKSYGARLSVALAGKETSVISLTMNDQFPSRAEVVINTLIEIYNEDWIENKNKAAVKTSEFISDRLAVIQKELGGVENDLKNYKERNRITNIQSVSSAYLSESSSYAAKSFEVNNQIAIAQYIKDYMNDPSYAEDLLPANSGLTNTSVNDRIKQYNDALINRNRLLAQSSVDNPAVAELNVALADIKVSIRRSIDNLIETLKLQAAKIKDQEDKLLGQIASTSGQELQILSIERQQKVKESLYIYLLQKREENEIASRVAVAPTRMIMLPNGSPSPVSPNSKMIMLVALILGLLIPFGIFFLISQLDTRVKSRADISRLQVPFLAEIPQMGIKGNWLQKLRAERYNDANCRILVKPGKRDMMNEAFRVLRTNIDVMTASQSGCQRIMVTSFNPNAGKTFIIMNMAASMALKGSKTLLLDLDLRKATLSKAVDKNRSGIASFLSGKTDDLLGHVENLADNLYLLPVGALPPNPAELLVSDRFDAMLDELSSKFDYIFIDCPPVDIVADTAIIAKHADITVFVMRAGLFDKRALPDVEAMYSDGNYNRMAVILNGVEPGHRGYGYGHYGYGYGYGHYGYGYGHGHYGYGEEESED